MISPDFVMVPVKVNTRVEGSIHFCDGRRARIIVASGKQDLAVGEQGGRGPIAGRCHEAGRAEGSSGRMVKLRADGPKPAGSGRG